MSIYQVEVEKQLVWWIQVQMQAQVEPNKLKAETITNPKKIHILIVKIPL